MKNSHTCPKCQSNDIVEIRPILSDYSSKLCISEFSCPIDIYRYMCGECGYLESYVKSEISIDKLKKKLSK